MDSRKRSSSLLSTLFLIVLLGASGGPSIGTTPRDADHGKAARSQQQREKKREKAAETGKSEEAEYTKLLWSEPSDLESRDLFYGIGGKERAPDLSGRFTFIERDRGGFSPKIIVEDEKGERWTVKFGPEAKAETAATRIVWAAGYHVDQDYFVKDVQIVGWDGPQARDVRFERDHDGFETVDNWSWRSNPFVGRRELDGFKVLMALMNNFDLKKANNKIVRSGEEAGGGDVGSNRQVYYVNDLGATFGSTGKWYTRIPICGELPAALWKAAGTKADAKAYAKERFIKRVKHGKVYFHFTRRKARRVAETVKIGDAVWMGNLLGRLSDKQIADAFLAGGFSEAEVSIYVKTFRDRITQLQNLQQSLATSDGTKYKYNEDKQS